MARIVQALEKMGLDEHGTPIKPSTSAAPPVVEPFDDGKGPSVFDREGPATIAFLEPCWGFPNAEAGRAYFNSLHQERRDREDILKPEVIGRKFYAPRFALNCGWPNTTDYLRPTDHRERRRNPEWVTLRGRDEVKPNMAYNVAMLVGGARKYYRHGPPRTAKHPGWWYRLVSGERDCFAIWRDIDGQSFGNSAYESVAASRLDFARSGRGVIYAVEADYNDAGQLFAEADRPIVLVRFSILDRDSKKDDMMRIETWRYADPDDALNNDGIDQGWKEMVENAVRGFDNHCRHTPRETEAWLNFFLDQWPEIEADNKLFSFGDGRSFRERMESFGNNWRGALAAVRKAWQLRVFASVHDHNPELWDVPGNYPGTSGQRLMKAIDSMQGEMSRWQELMKMVRDFVEPADGLWNYCGD
ncbi:MAG: hypothetical protein WC702_00720 [Patescibacteria group bacterium]|jgi:hypothetical protein